METLNGFKDVHEFISQDGFPCIGARAALAKNQIVCVEGGSMISSESNERVLAALYSFIEKCRDKQGQFHSFVVTFDRDGINSEKDFDRALWSKLQSFHDLDSKNFSWDPSVSSDPYNKQFSFSLGEVAFFIIGLNPFSSRRSRRFSKPALVFNMHRQFEKLKETTKFNKLRDSIRQNDGKFCGSKNPMLEDHGEESEAKQYSGRQLENAWQCPFIKRN